MFEQWLQPSRLTRGSAEAEGDGWTSGDGADGWLVGVAGGLVKRKNGGIGKDVR